MQIDRKELERLLYAGHGRAIVYLLQQDLREYRDLILDFCVHHNKCYDRQLEPNRDAYLYPLIEASGESDWYKNKIIEALYNISDDFDISQIYDFLWLFAEEDLGINDVIKDAKSKNKYFAEYLKDIEPTPKNDVIDVRRKRKELYESVEGLSWEEMKAFKSGFIYYDYWARQTSEDEFIKASNDVILETDRKELFKMLSIFKTRLFPFDLKILINLFNVFDDASYRILYILGNIESNEVRNLFYKLIKDSNWIYHSLILLKSNYKIEDNTVINSILMKAEDNDDIHRVCQSSLDIFECNLSPDAIEILIMMYDKSPCSLCRERSAELLKKLGPLPQFIIDELVYDCQRKP